MKSKIGIFLAVVFTSGALLAGVILLVYSFCSQEKEVVRTPADANTLSYGDGRYVKFITKEGQDFAGVVVPKKMLVKSPKAPPGINRRRAKMYLNQALRHRQDDRTWEDVKKEEKRGRVVFIFRALAEEEMKEVERAREEMAHPLPSLEK